MTADERRTDWDVHKLKVYEKFDNLDDKIGHNAKTNEKQYEMLTDISKSIADMNGELKLFKFKIAGLSAVVSGIITFISRHLG